MNNFVIYCNENIKFALLKLQKNKKRFLICLNNNNSVIGVLTDGDIRKGFLNELTIYDEVSMVMNVDFEYLSLESTFNDVCEKFKSDKIDFLPIVDENMKLLNVITKKQFHIMLLENISFDLKYNFSAFDHYVLEHEIYNRPWGFYKSVILTSNAQAKIITVFPGEELSLQEHKKREEHWIIIKGRGKLILDESLSDIFPGKYIYIPRGCKHQIINNSDENIVLSEIQLGEYFGEDDIIRYADKYGRK